MNVLYNVSSTFVFHEGNNIPKGGYSNRKLLPPLHRYAEEESIRKYLNSLFLMLV